MAIHDTDTLATIEDLDTAGEALALADFIRTNVLKLVERDQQTVVYVKAEDGTVFHGARLEKETLTDGGGVYNVVLRSDTPSLPDRAAPPAAEPAKPAGPPRYLGAVLTDRFNSEGHFGALLEHMPVTDLPLGPLPFERYRVVMLSTKRARYHGDASLALEAHGFQMARGKAEFDGAGKPPPAGMVVWLQPGEFYEVDPDERSVHVQGWEIISPETRFREFLLLGAVLRERERIRLLTDAQVREEMAAVVGEVGKAPPEPKPF